MRHLDRRRASGRALHRDIAPEPATRSGDLARQLGVSADTLRHYERLGILPRPPRGSNGYRLYPPEAGRRVRLIRGALDLGFTLRELARVLGVRDGGGAPCRTVRDLAAQKLQETEARIDQLTILRADLRRVLRDWDRCLEETPRGQRAGLLEALSRSEGRARPRGRGKRFPAGKTRQRKGSEDP